MTRTILMLEEVRVEVPSSEKDRQAVTTLTAKLRARLKDRQDRVEAQRRRINEPLRH